MDAMTDLVKEGDEIATRLSDCRGIVESSDLPTVLCKTVTDCIAESSAFMRTEIERLQARQELLEAALKDMFALIDEGWLVRDIRRDGNPLWALEQIGNVRRLADAKKALDNTMASGNS